MVKRVLLWWRNEDAFLCALEMFDRAGKSLLKLGYFYTPDSVQHEVIINDGERIVGIASRTDGAQHYDF
jgi:hypothetical protein